MNENNINIGNCGEYFVAGELERRGWHVAVPMSNVPSFDLLAINKEDLTKQICIQVKTTSKLKSQDVMMNVKAETIIGDNIFYVFVFTRELGIPEYYIVPSAVVANYVTNAFKGWIAQKPEERSNSDSTVRHWKIKDDRFYKADFSSYKDAWNILNQTK